MKKSIYVILFAILVSGTANASLVAHYEFEGNANDSAGSANGTLMGDATYGTGPTYGGKISARRLALTAMAIIWTAALHSPRLPQAQQKL